jgi:hypothetical protein
VAKPNKADKADRRAVVEQMRREQKRKERRQSLMVVGAAVTVGAVIIGIAVWQFMKAESGSANELAGVGVAASEAGCQEVVAKDAEGGNDHRADGEKILYPQAPPAFGPHWGTYLQGTEIRKLYTTEDRPAVEKLVHSLEHGHTILWYDETIAEDDEALEQVEEVAEAAANSDDARGKFMAAPWTSDDGGEFPEGTHLALTHWSIGGDGDPSGSQQGIRQFCDAVSGDAVEDFIAEYPSSDSPEANAP